MLEQMNLSMQNPISFHESLYDPIHANAPSSASEVFLLYSYGSEVRSDLLSPPYEYDHNWQLI